MNKLKQTKVGIISLGCPKNLVDTEVMIGQLLFHGFIITQDVAKAEIIIINTCSFIGDARKESSDTINEISKLKKKGKLKKIIVTGCLPQRYSDNIEKKFPEVDSFVGTNEFYKIHEIISNAKDKKHIGSDLNFIYDHRTPRLSTAPFYSSYLKIAEGCSKKCSFCIIPKIRGNLRSRPIDSIIQEAENLANLGVREINLISQELNSYGMDLGEDHNLTSLLKELVKINDLKWIRLFYTYPKNFKDELLEMVRDEKKLCKYIDLPIQHISDNILEKMRREVSEKQVRDLIYKIRDFIPDAFLRTSIIVGFPGETDDDFDKLLSFVREVKFSFLGTFKYSDEDGTESYDFSDKIPAKIIDERYDAIMSLQKEISKENNKKLIGKIYSAVIEKNKDKNTKVGRIKNQAPEIDGITFIKTKTGRVGDFVDVEIVGGDEYDLVGNIYKSTNDKIQMTK